MYSWRVSEASTHSGPHAVCICGIKNSLGCANLKGFAPHIHVLYREVPYILYITHPRPHTEDTANEPVH